MGMKKGYLFTTDSLIAVLLFITVMFALPVLYLDKKESTNLNYYATDMIKVLSTLTIDEADNDYVDYLIEDYNVSASNQTILEEVGRLWVLGYEEQATLLVKNITYGLVPENTGLGVYIEGSEVYSNNFSKEDYLVSSKHMVSGIEPGKPITGLSSRAYLDDINEKSSSAYAFFGGFVGNGNVSKKLFIPNMATIVNASMELDVTTGFRLYINNHYSGTFNSSGQEFDAETFYVNRSYFTYFQDGENLVKLVFSGTGSDYVGGGYFKVKYSTPDISSGDIEIIEGNAIDRYWFPGIDGIINLYSSFYVPGSLNEMTIYLHYFANHTLSFQHDLVLRIGNTTVLVDNLSTTTQTITLNSSFLNSTLDYSFLSKKTIPIRFGFENITPVEIVVGGYKGDTAVTTDLSGSMDTCDVDDSAHLIPGDCGSPGDRAQRIAVARYVDKFFVHYVLNTSGNRVGLASYGTTLDDSLDLTDDELLLNDTIDDYDTLSSPYYYTCISCGVYESIQLLLKDEDYRFFIPRNSDWLYNISYRYSEPPDDGSGDNWTDEGFDDSSWKNGTAAFGTYEGSSTIINGFYANLSELAPDLETPELDFTSGIMTSANTFCHPPCTLSPATQDGWDYDVRAYTTNDDDTTRTRIRTPNGESGYTSYNNVETGSNKWIQIEIRNDNYARDDSAAFGIQFNITPDMYDIISHGGTATLSFDYYADDVDNDLEEGAWIKARFGDGTTMNYLGSNLDSGDTYNDATAEIWCSTDYPSSGFEEGGSYGDGITGTYSLNVSQYITHKGYYYLDLGAKGSGDYYSSEGFIASFDNILLTMYNETGNVYFRKRFSLENLSNYTSVSLFVYSDDMADVYINDVLIDNDSSQHDAYYWNREVAVPLQYLNEGENEIAVKLYNNDSVFGFDLALGEKRKKAMIVMSDGEANRCHGPDDGIIDTNGLSGSCTTSQAAQEAIDFACYAHENYGISVFAVAFGNAGAASIATLNKTACCDDCSHFYTSTNVTGLVDIYANIVEELHKINVEKVIQAYNVTGNYSKNILYPDSYIMFNYTPGSLGPAFGKVPISIESARFGGPKGNFYIPPNTEVTDAKVTSFSGKRWTNLVRINNTNLTSWRTVFNLSEFSGRYPDLGDPYIVQVPAGMVSSGNNSVIINIGDNMTSLGNGSSDDRAIITVNLDLQANYSSIYPEAEGCRWYVEFEDGSNTTIKVPSGYSGSNSCYYMNYKGSLNVSFSSNDSIDWAVYNLFRKLDIDDNGRLYVNFGQGEFNINTIFIKDIPYLWGPTLIEVRTWQ